MKLLKKINIICFIIIINNLYAEQLYIQPYIGLLNIKTEEVIKDEQQRKLIWPIENIVYQGIGAEYEYKNIIANVNMNYINSNITGKVRDINWIDNNNEYNSMLEKYYNLQMNISYNIKILKYFYIEPIITYNNINIKWNAKGVYNNEATMMEGTSITYEQKWNYISLGMYTGVQPTNNIDFNVGIKYIPATTCIEENENYISKIQYSSVLYGEDGIESQINIKYKKEKININIRYTYIAMIGLNGDTNMVSINTNNPIKATIKNTSIVNNEGYNIKILLSINIL